MSENNIGNSLYHLTFWARAALFDQGESAQLTYMSFETAMKSINSIEWERIKVSCPVGYGPDRQVMASTHYYTKEDLLGKYQHLISYQFPLNGLVQLVTIVEALFSDVVRRVITHFPHKLGAKRTIPLQQVLEAKTIEDIHLRACDTLVNDLAYKSPREFAESLDSILSINLFECPAFHKYIELKATRDIFIHNRGIANETYIRKADSHARARIGQMLPIDILYFLESYESCIQLTEWLERKLHECWYSSEFDEAYNNAAHTTPEIAASAAAPGDGIATFLPSSD